MKPAGEALGARVSLRVRGALVTLGQLAALTAISLGCDWLSRRFALPLPGNVIGAIVLFALLSVGAVRLAWVERGGDLLLKHLSLFFVPAAVGVLRHRATLRPALVEIAIVLVVTTALAMLTTGVAAERLARRETRSDEDDRGGDEDDASDRPREGVIPP